MIATVAKTVADVQRLAPVDGWYWLETAADRWMVVRLRVEEPDKRFWQVAGNTTDFPDKRFVGFTIAGPLSAPSAGSGRAA